MKHLNTSSSASSKLCLCLCWSIILIFLISIVGPIEAKEEAGTSGVPLRNIALGRPYTLYPQPNYPLCNGPDVARLLTDGKYTSGNFWTQKSTVGWMYVPPPVITIDLGAICAIRGLSYNTVAGAGGVQWPSAIYVFVSDDGKSFYEAGELVSLSGKRDPQPEAANTYEVRRYWTDALSTHGRYLSLVVLGKPFVFVDEIEVYQGDAAWVGSSFSGTPVSDLKSIIPVKLVSSHINARLKNDIQSIRTSLASLYLSGEPEHDVLARLASAEEELSKSGGGQDQDSPAVIPLNPLHERIFKIQAQLWRAMGLPRLSIWQNPLWDPLEPIHTPSSGSAPSVDVHMMLNEYRAGAFNISNASDKEISLGLEIVGLPGGSDPSYITVHEAVWTGTSGGYCYPAALPEARKSNGTYLIRCPSGLTRQVWLTFHPRKIAPGVYHGRIILNDGVQKQDVPLKLNIYPFNFPDQPTLHLGGFDYTDRDALYGVTPRNKDKIITHLREHFVDSPLAASSVLPFESPGGWSSYQPNTARFDRWLQQWQGARQYLVFMNVGDHLGGSPMGTPVFVEKVKQWITFWAKHAQLRGLRADQLNLVLVDEPKTPEQDEVIIQWARAIRAAGTGVKIWEDTVHKNFLQDIPKIMAYCDVLCPDRWRVQNFSDLRDLIQRQGQGIELALYSCKGPARELDPYTYYRLQSWVCWLYGARSSYFWSFTDTGGASSWNEYRLTKDAYVPFFIDAASVTAGKQMEAIREGIEDYEYLVMLGDRIADIQKREPKSDILDRARDLLTNAPKQVCTGEGVNSPLWSEKKLRNLADDMRLEILELLSEIQISPVPNRN